MEGPDLHEAMQQLLKFREERDWRKFHTPKNLSMSIAIESAELMENFQWKTEQEIEGCIKAGSIDFRKIKDEIADVAAYLLLLSHDLNIDLNLAILDKIKKNELKYPINKSKGRNSKYTDL